MLEYIFISGCIALFAFCCGFPFLYGLYLLAQRLIKSQSVGRKDD